MSLRRSPSTLDDTRKVNLPKAFLARAAVPAVAAFLTCSLPARADDGQDVVPPALVQS
jgi:hypothetical protein